VREFLLLIDTLEDTVEDAKSEALTGCARVDRLELYAIVDELRRAIPEEIQHAHWIAAERDEMLAQARREAERTLQEARQESARLLGAEELTKHAERRASTFLDKARLHKRDIHLDAESYADDILKNVESYFERLAAVVQRSRDRLPDGARA